MKLPYANLAVVPEKKVTHYLLNPAHPTGQSKASFFLRFGFSVDRWEEFAQALMDHAKANDVSSTGETTYGVSYSVDGPIKAPCGATLNIRTAWYIDHGAVIPRFVTAHPLPKS